ncbi:50S ribosomal protein L29 [Candidatus Bathyarchaeota archaeon]|nr:50S ribosomal protein L29 [Candidatus Bathyarchaeota archaeon]MCJ7731379.1 50S ribosomal protein L29 [Candidatus Bathyarchaeota archaeon]TFH19172.1 MAG: 50S ribosomal protein L29 [Candidatus Bathyarchaeota archaeon]
MPILRMEEIRKMPKEDKEEKLQELRTELTKLKTMIKAGGAIENPGRTRVLKKTIARILTVINEEE